jgi:osmotically-inducible protein OsmY
VSRSDDVIEAHIQRLLAENEDIAEQGITVARRDAVVVLCGVVETPARRDQIVRMVSEYLPDTRVESEITIAETDAPSRMEKLS